MTKMAVDAVIATGNTRTIALFVDGLLGKASAGIDELLAAGEGSGFRVERGQGGQAVAHITMLRGLRHVCKHTPGPATFARSRAPVGS